LVAFATASPGPGLDPDAESYLGAAQSLARIGTYRVPTTGWSAIDSTEPMTHFPPGMSTLIAAPVALGLTPIAAGRLINIVAALLTWSGLVALMTSAASLRVGLWTGAAALATPALVMVHLSILSEPAFLASLIAGVGAMWAYARSATFRAALGVGLSVTAAVLLRYAGMALVLAAILWIWAAPSARRLGRWARFGRLLLVVAPTACLLGAWLVHATRLEGPQGVRTVATYGGLMSAIRDAVTTAGSWAIPPFRGRWTAVVAVVALAAVAAMGADAWRRVRRIAEAQGDSAPAVREARDAAMLGCIVGLTLVVYLAFLMASREFADPHIPMDERLLAPAFLLIEMLVALVIAVWWRGRRRGARAVTVTLLAAWGALAAGTSTSRIVFAREDGNDFANVDWRDSPTLAWVRSPTGGLGRVLYTNWPAAVYFQAGRASHDLPSLTDALTMHRFRERLRLTGGVLVGFSTPSLDWASPDTVAARLHLREVARFPDGTVWELP
jgi:hypothetical protein